MFSKFTAPVTMRHLTQTGYTVVTTARLSHFLQELRQVSYHFSDLVLKANIFQTGIFLLGD